MTLRLRPVTPDDQALLEDWDRRPHMAGITGEGDWWDWAEALANPAGFENHFIAELDGRPIGFMAILDPARDPENYWGAYLARHPETVRAVDIWIGEPDCLGQGHGTEMMRLALARCFADPAITAVILDPVAGNTAAHRFYEHLGFRFVERRRFGPDDCFVYRLARGTWQDAPGGDAP